MISFKLNGISEVVKKLSEENLIPLAEIDKAVKSSAMPLVNRIKENYAKEGHKITGRLINSIEAFKRNRKGADDPYFTYYIGPRYGAGGGNHAHFLEYGVPYSSYPIKGQGKTIRGRKYGNFATKSGYRIKPTGTIRRSKDEKENEVLRGMEKGLVKAIIQQAQRKGFAIK